jgi:polar amino acid transport system substrate-binding protein
MRYLSVSVIMSCSVGLTTFWANDARAQNVWDKIYDTGQLVCGAMSGSPIGSWSVPGPAQYEGYSINLCRQIGQDLSVEMGKPIMVDYQETTWGTVVLDLQAGKIDLWAGMSATEERQQALDMAGPLYELAHCMVNRQGLTGLETWQDYNNSDVRISMITGTSDEQAIKEHAPNATHLSFRQASEAILAVQAGRADAYGTSVLSCLRILNEAPEVFGEIVFPEPVQSLPSSAGIRRDGDGRFNAFVQDWADKNRENGRVGWLMIDAVRKAGLDAEALPEGFRF